MKTLRVGTRGSELARTQTEEVAARLREAGYAVETVRVQTAGDAAVDARFAELGPDIFTRALDDALREGRIDCAVHSAKDVPSEIPEGISLGAFVRRIFPEDALVCFRGAGGLDGIPPGGRVGTSSLRRRALMLSARRDLTVVELRGNVRTRIRRGREAGLDAAVLARAGLVRLGLEREVTELLDPHVFVPQAGQGALAVTCRADDPLISELGDLLDDTATRHAVTAERAFLRRLGGGCHVPAGAYAQAEGGRVRLRAVLLSVDGSRRLATEREAAAGEADRAGIDAADELLDRGGDMVRSLRGGSRR